jgi:tetratricopeptide (TPR) repeat protein
MAESGPSVAGTWALVALSIAGLSIADTYLARTERSENHAEAERLAAGARALTAKGRAADAVLQFKDALAIERENPGYGLALGEAQLAAGEYADAEATLTELLAHDSTSGAANLALARVLVKERRVPDAVSAYHRAIFGHWDRDAGQNQVNVRFELVNLLAREESKEELLAELLPLVDLAPDNIEVQKRVGQLFLVAGSAQRAGEVFRGILRTHPQDADAYEGLGEAELARANYQTAHSSFLTAENLRPSNELVARLNLTAKVLALDPMRRGIDAQQQYARSLTMLDLAEDSIKECSGGMTPLEADALEEAEKVRSTRPRSDRMSKAVDANLNMAEQLWKIRMQECKRAPTAREEPLRLVLARIAQ